MAGRLVHEDSEVLLCYLQLSDPKTSARPEPCCLAFLQMDAGSLNGTTLNGTVISKAGRMPGDPVPLSDGDAVEFGSVTRARVQCSPSAPAKRHHAENAGEASAGQKLHIKLLQQVSLACSIEVLVVMCVSSDTSTSIATNASA